MIHIGYALALASIGSFIAGVIAQIQEEDFSNYYKFALALIIGGGVVLAIGTRRQRKLANQMIGKFL